MSRESLNQYIKRTQLSFVNVKGRSYGQSVDHPAFLSHLLHTILQSVPTRCMHAQDEALPFSQLF